jgi:hypothetical protein
MGLLARVWMGVRLLKARLRHTTVRFKTADLPRLYRRLEEAGVPYVVLRWSDEVPWTPAEEQAYHRDVDHLVGEGCTGLIARISSGQPGAVSCDYYDAAGRRGGAYRGMPYYMPALAGRILSRRVRHPRGFFVPCPEDALHAFLYHLVYHKGALCGLESGLGVPAVAASRDYGAEARRLAALVGITLPEPLTLVALHEYLRSVGWSMAGDLFPRWGDQHPVLRALAARERELTAGLVAQAQDLTVFILRSDGGGEAGAAVARREIAKRFRILREEALDGAVRDRVVGQTRGGSWVEKGQPSPIWPTRALICRNAEVPGPLPAGYSAAKVRRRYPHVAHTDVLIKREVRAKVAALPGVSPGAAVLHATDNPLEAVDTLRAIYAEALEARLAELRQA